MRSSSLETLIALLHQLSENLNLQPEEALHPDRNERCRIKINGSLTVQLELDKSSLIFSSHLGSISSGKYREELLLSALKENSLYPPSGILCYIPRNNELALFRTLPVGSYDAAELTALFEAFSQKALLWHDAINRGRTSP